VKLHHVTETYVLTNPVLFGRSLPLLWKKLSDSRNKPSDLWKKPWRRRTTNAFQKGVPNRGINFKDATVSLHHTILTGVMHVSLAFPGGKMPETL